MPPRIIRSMTRLAFGALALTVAGAATAEAQATAPAAYRGVVGFNPLGIPFNIFSAELEGAISQGFTIGANANYLDTGSDNERFTSFEVKGRYYPQEVALSGFSLGLGVGVLKFSNVFFGPFNGTSQPTETRLSHSSPTISIAADYNWLLGSQRRFLVGGGIGAKRVLNRGDDERIDVPRAYPTGRFIVGLAF